MRESKFTLKECIKVLDNVESIWGIKKEGSLTLEEFNFAIVKTTGKIHQNFLKQFVVSLNNFGCIKLSQNKNVVTIILDGDDLK